MNAVDPRIVEALELVRSAIWAIQRYTGINIHAMPHLDVQIAAMKEQPQCLRCGMQLDQDWVERYGKLCSVCCSEQRKQSQPEKDDPYVTGLEDGRAAERERIKARVEKTIDSLWPNWNLPNIGHWNQETLTRFFHNFTARLLEEKHD